MLEKLKYQNWQSSTLNGLFLYKPLIYVTLIYNHKVAISAYFRKCKN